MFAAISPTWSAGTGASQAANTDWSLSGTSRRLDFTVLNAQVTATFSSVNLALWEELTLYVYVSRRLTSLTEVLRITVDGEDFDLPRQTRDTWQHILINAADRGAVTTIVFKSLLDEQTAFIDLLGVRKYDPETADSDIADAFKAAIDLDYGVTTTLAAAASAGDTSISLTSDAYVFNTSRLRITDGVHTEDVDLLTTAGDLKNALAYSYASGSTVTVICPVETESRDGIEPDPVCGVNVMQVTTEGFSRRPIDLVGSSKIKRFLGEATIQVYVDCQSKLKTLSLSRQYQASCGDKFSIILDGEVFDVYLDYDQFLDRTDAGNNPRMSWFYKVEPSPFTMETLVPVTDFTYDIQPGGAA